jgi:drug/metabolite transporter (DMT)-like permease
MPTLAPPKPRLVSPRIEGLGWVLFTACTWGITWPITKFLMTMVPPYSVRSVSGTIGFLLALAIAAIRGERIRPPRDQWPRLLLYGMLNYGFFLVLTMQALSRLRASEAVTITYTIPVWTVLLSWPLLKERPTPIKLLALILALGGVALLVGADSASFDWSKAFPATLAFGAAISFGLGTVLAKQKPLRLPPATSVFWQAMIGVILVTLFAIPEHRDWAGITPLGWASMIYIGAIPLSLAYLTWFRALKLVSASTAAMTVLISPLVGVIGSGLLLGETFGPRQVIALAMTLTGVALAAR